MNRSLRMLSIMLLMMIIVASSMAQIPRLVSFQGVLSDTLGNPKPDGSYSITFRLYNVASGGSALWTEAKTLQVKGGLFSTNLGDQVVFPASLTFGTSYWLSIQIAAQPVLSPRILLTPAGYSLHAVAADTAAYALATPAQPPADSVRVAGSAHGVILPSYSGVTSSSYGLDIDNGSGTGDGIRAYSGSTFPNYGAIYAVNSGGTTAGEGGPAVYGYSVNGYGVSSLSQNYRGLYAQGATAWYAAYIENPGGSASPGLYVDGTLWVTGAKTGYVADLAYNDGPDPLEMGDVVAITGYQPPVTGEMIPVVKVRKASIEEGHAVAGVAEQMYIVNTAAMAQQATTIPGIKAPGTNAPAPTAAAGYSTGPTVEPLPHPASAAERGTSGNMITAGNYFLMVTLGSFKAIKVDATYGSIQPGDLLVASPSPGYAMRSENPRAGTIIGKAMGSLPSGKGSIPVMVTLH